MNSRNDRYRVIIFIILVILCTIMLFFKFSSREDNEIKSLFGFSMLDNSKLHKDAGDFFGIFFNSQVTDRTSGEVIQLDEFLFENTGETKR
ncbi:MAG: hypothetical protein V1720_04690 [bacterium]